MIKFELPVVFVNEEKQSISITTFRLFEPYQIITNESVSDKRTTLRFSGNEGDSWLIDADKIAVDQIVDEAINKGEFYND